MSDAERAMWFSGWTIDEDGMPRRIGKSVGLSLLFPPPPPPSIPIPPQIGPVLQLCWTTNEPEIVETHTEHKDHT